MKKSGNSARWWRRTVEQVATTVIEEYGVEAFWRVERLRRDATLSPQERRLSEDVFAEVERRTRVVRSTMRPPPVSLEELGL